MQNFKFSQPTNVIFGKGTQDTVGKYAKKFGKNVLIVYGSDRVNKNGLLESVEKSLTENGVSSMRFSGIKPNPVLSKVYEGIDICKENHIDSLLAVGGGSVIDSCKAIALGVKYSGDVWDLYIQKDTADAALPIGIILTIPAAGSEANKYSVITNDTTGFKRGMGMECTKPKYAILNPELTYSLPAFQTACGSIDIIMHTFERYFTPTKNVALTDRLCEAVILTVLEQTPLALKNPNDYDARAELMWAGTVAHNDILETGRLGDWATHNISHEVSGAYDLTHGAALAIISPAWMTYVYKKDTDRFIKFSERIMGIDSAGLSTDAVILKAIAHMKSIFSSWGVPTSLSEAGIDDAKFSEMAEKAVVLGEIGEFTKLGRDDIVNIYKLAK